MTKLKELINHPELMNRDTLYELRSILALYPYFQTARLLMLQNLYLLHDPTFDEELRRAAIYITDRKVIFQMVEAAHYQLQTSPKSRQTAVLTPDESRTMSLIDTFLDSIPEDSEEKPVQHRQPTPADAAVDYVSYLLACEDAEEVPQEETPQMKGQTLIDHFLQEEKGRILLNELPQETTTAESAGKLSEETEEEIGEEYFTETLARIYIKQGRYQKALDIIDRLSKQLPKKNAYFEDQKRFLEKLIINNKQQ